MFPVVYADGTVMIDSGMDEQVHKFFGRGAIEPYDAAAAKQIEGALRRARLIVVTLEHGDHAAVGLHTPWNRARAQDSADPSVADQALNS